MTITIAFEKRLTAAAHPFDLDVRFTTPARGVTALFGKSGAGKTTIINTIAGLVKPDAGRITIDAQVFFDAEEGIDLPVHARGIGYVFQDGRLFPHRSVEANLRYGERRANKRWANKRRVEPRAHRITFVAVVEMLGLGTLLTRRPHHLSGGEKQRVALGRALLSQPRLLLMDEPLAALDAPRKAEVMTYIERLRDDFRIPILYVSHALDEVARLADHLVVIADGKVAASGDLLSVMSASEHAPLFGRAETGTVLDCVVASHDARYDLTTLAFPGGQLRVPQVTLPPGTHVRARLRARDVSLSLTLHDDVSLSNQLAGCVATMVPRPGPYMEIVVAVGPSTVRALITRESCDRLALVVGKPVWAMIKSVSLDHRNIAATTVAPLAPAGLVSTECSA